MAQFKTWNSTLWNQHVWNGGSFIDATPTSDEDFSFIGYGLQNEKIVVSRDDEWNNPERDIQTAAVPNGHGQIINSDFFRTKTVVLEGMLHGGTAVGLDALIDQFKSNLSVQGGNLDIKRGTGLKRRYIATATSIEVGRDEHFRVSSCPFTVTFACYDPFSQDEGYTSGNFEVTVSSFEEILENPGTASADPVILIVVESGTVDMTEISVTSQTTDQKISISGTFVPGDVIIFDGEAKEVTLNASAIEFSGSFAEVIAGANSFKIDATATSVSYEFTWKVLGKYL